MTFKNHYRLLNPKTCLRNCQFKQYLSTDMDIKLKGTVMICLLRLEHEDKPLGPGQDKFYFQSHFPKGISKLLDGTLLLVEESKKLNKPRQTAV